MKTSRMLVAASCAAMLLSGASAAFAQRGGGGHGGGGGGFHGGGGGFHGGMGMSRGGAPSTVRHGGGFRGMSGGVVRGGIVHGHRFVGPVHYFRPYYAFHPNVSIGFGLWAGYPFAYPYAFYNPYYYSYYPYYSNYPYYSDNHYPPSGSVSSDVYASPSGAVPDQTNMGGLSFEITPNDAEVFVDNVRVGTVGEFTSTTQPLGVAAGRHHVEIRAVGYQTMSVDVDIVAGQVFPYQGSLER